MSEYIRLPRSVLTDDLWRDGNLARLLFYLLSKADENGEIQTDMAAISRDLALSRQTVRTLMKKVEANQMLTKSSTTRTTKLKLDIQEDKPKHQPRRQPNQQPNTNQIKPLAPDYISPPFVAPEFREIWRRFIAYRKEIKKPYKSEASERTAYNKMVKMADNDPAVAEDMVECTILGQWQGLFKNKNYGNGNNNAQYRTPGCDKTGTCGTDGVAKAILERIADRKNQ